MALIISPADIGAAVRRARKAASLRQDDLAGLAGVGTRFLIELEAGKPTMRLDKLLAVLATLGIDLHLDPHLDGVLD
jgi:y4mF family transcriptional regulator